MQRILSKIVPSCKEFLVRREVKKLDSIKERVGAYIERTGATKGEIAEQLGMTRVTLHSKLSGQTEFRLSEAERLANILGCTVDDLRISPYQ